MKKSILLLGLMVAAISACTAKKRDAALPYGADRDLLKISEYDGAEFTLITDGTKTVSAGNSTNNKIQDDTKKVKFHNFATYSTKAELLDNSPFLGEPNQTYQIKYLFDDKKLKVFKVGAEKDFSYEELVSARANKLADGRLASPLVSYSVSFFSTDNSRNENNEVTHRLDLVSQESKANSTYFKIDRSSKEIAEYIKKDLHFPADFFDRDWYFASTMVGQNYKDKGSDTRTILEWTTREKASKVKVKKEEKRISFYGLNLDPSLKKEIVNREENQETVLSIPVQWKEYKMRPTGRGTSVSEQEDSTVAWEKRSYVQLDPAQLSMPMLNQDLNTDLRDVQIGEQAGRKYLSILVFVPSLKSLIRYSFLEAKNRNDTPAYVPKVYLKEDRKVFGFFSTDMDVLKSPDKSNIAEDRENHFLNRFNPALKTIRFLPSEQTPEIAMDIAEKATKAWNATFAAAGTGMQIEFDRTKKVRLGDLRYNQINISVDPDGNDPWWGFGPSIADLETGEIVSATANVNLSSMLQWCRALMKTYIRNQAGEVSTSAFAGLFSSAGETSTLPQIGFSQLLSAKSGNLSEARYLPKVNLQNPLGFEWREVKTITTQPKANRFNARASENVFDGEYANISEEILSNEKCKDLNSYAGQLKKGEARKTIQEENLLVESCAWAILEPRAVNTLLHEMGHNFGLRHNFYGNNDSANFWPAKDQQKQIPNSTVMEYPHFDNSNLMTPGFYDIAAIKWGYSNKLLAQNGASDLANYDERKPIQLQKVAEEMRKFKFCTDEDTGFGARVIDPLCALHDKGLSATDTVKNYIQSYQYSLAGRRTLEQGILVEQNSEDLAFAAASRSFNGIFLPVKKFYDYYRLLIASEFPDRSYLENETSESFKAMLASLERKLQTEAPGIKIDAKSDSPEFAKQIAGYYAHPLSRAEKKYVEFLDYKKAAQLAYQFLKSVAFMPDYYCQIENAPLKILSFSKVQELVFQQTGKTITACPNSTGGSVQEFGYPLFSIARELDNSKSSEAPVTFGNIYDRLLAAQTLSLRAALLQQSEKYNLHANFFDEPEQREELETLTLSRLLKGLDLKALDPKNKQFVSLFQTEKVLLNFLYRNLYQGELVPSKPDTSSARLARFAAHYSLTPGDVSLPDAQSVQLGGATVYALPQNEVAIQLVAKLKELRSARETTVPDDDAFKAYQEFLLPKLLSKEKSAGKMTVAELADVFNSADDAEKLEKIGKNVFVLKRILSADFERVWKGVVKPFIARTTSAAKDEEEIKKLLEKAKKADVLELCRQAKVEFTLYKETIGPRLAELKSKLQKEMAEYGENRSELDAQADILLMAISASNQ